MNYIIKLSREARNRAQRTCIIQNFWNGLGVGFVVGDIIALLALFYNANSLQMALLFSALYISFPVAMLAPKFMAGSDCSSIWRWMWVVRTALLPAYLLVPLLPSQYQAWAVILIYFSFCALRSIGVSASFPVLQVLTSESERPVFMSRNVRSFTFGFMIVVLIAYLILEIGVFSSDLYNYQLLVVLGTIFSSMACIYLFALPHTGSLQKTDLCDILRVTRTALKDWQCRRVIILMMINTFVVILCGYMIPYMKEFMQLSSGNVVLMSLIGLVGAVLATQMLQIIGPRISSWGLILAANILVFAGVIFFCVSEPIASKAYMLFFIPAVVLIYFGRQAGLAVLLKVQTDAIPENDRYAFSAVFQLSGVVSSILAVGYIKLCEAWLQNLPIFHGNKYIPIFLACGIFSLLACTVILACHGLFRTATDLKLLAPRSLLAFVQVHMLSLRNGRISRLHGLEELMSRNNSLSRSLVMEFLQSRNITHRNAAMRSLLMQQIDESRQHLLADALDPDSPNREMSISALGLQNPDPAYIPSILKLLNERSGPIRSSALKTLMRYRYPIDAERFTALYAGFTDAMQKTNALIGVSWAQRIDLLSTVFNNDRHYSDEWLATVFQTLADIFDRRTEMVDLIDAAFSSPAEGESVLNELIDHQPEAAQTQVTDVDWLPQNTTLTRCCSSYLLYLLNKHKQSDDSKLDIA